MVEGLISLGFLFLLLGAGVWIAVALCATGILSLLIFTDFPPGKIMAVNIFNWNNDFVLASLPMFILMGQLLFHCGINRTLYRGLSPWLDHVPGKLFHSNIVACSLFAAISGSSGATVATVGTVAVPELQRLGYQRSLLLGSLAGAGTLGLLIPPSIVMIVYCILVRESVGQLFIAGIIPGLVVAGLFMGYIAVIAKIHPEVAPGGVEYSWKDRLRGIADIVPTSTLIFLVLGGIYMGWSTPSEAATIGCAGAVVLGLMNRAFNWKVLKAALTETLYISGLFIFIMTGACFYATSVAYIGFSGAVAEFIISLPVSPYVILGLVAVLYLGLGCLMDGASMLVLTVPILYSGLTGLGFDSIWLGVFLVILIEVAQITPPVGINLYILSGISGESIGTIVRASIPFFFLLLLGCVIITIFPDLSLWLPSQMIR